MPTGSHPPSREGATSPRRGRPDPGAWVTPAITSACPLGLLQAEHLADVTLRAHSMLQTRASVAPRIRWGNRSSEG